MSWDCTLTDAETGREINLDKPHHITGGTYVLGGTTELTLNVTYNYTQILRKALGGDGLNDLHDKTGREAVIWLIEGAEKLKDEYSEDYWEATEGNVKTALLSLAELSAMAPRGIWKLS